MKAKKENGYDYKNGNRNKIGFFQLTKPKVIIYALLIFSLSTFSLNANFPSRGTAVLIFNALLNTALILFLYVIACLVSFIPRKVRGK